MFEIPEEVHVGLHYVMFLFAIILLIAIPTGADQGLSQQSQKNWSYLLVAFMFMFLAYNTVWYEHSYSALQTMRAMSKEGFDKLVRDYKEKRKVEEFDYYK